MQRLGRLVSECHQSRPEAKAFLVMLPPPGEACAGVAAAAEAAAAAAPRASLWVGPLGSGGRWSA